MPTQPTSISAAPTTPDRTARTTFATQMYNFFVWMAGTLATGMNSLATNVYNNALEVYNAVVGKTLAQYKGIYAGGTTYALGDQVYYLTGYWVSNVGANTGNTPSTSPTQWSSLGTGLMRQGGATTTGSVILSASSAYTQRVNTTAAGQSLTFPDATTCSTGPGWAVHNTGPFDLRLIDATGVTRGFVPAMTMTRVDISDISTVAGGFDCSNINLFGITASLEVLSGLTLGTTSTAVFQAVPLDATHTALFVMGTGQVTIYCMVYDAGAPAWGNPVAVSAVAQTTSFQAVTLSASSIILWLGLSGGTNRVQAVGVSITGTTPSGGAASVVAASGAVTLQTSCAVGSSACLTYNDGTTVKTVAATTAGSVASAGSAQTISSAIGSGHAYASGSVLVVFSGNGTANTLAATPFTVAGNVLTLGTAAVNANFTGGLNNFRSLVVNSAGWFVIGSDSTNTRTIGDYFTLSGTVMSHSQAILETGTANVPSTGTDAQLINGRVLFASTSGNYALVSFAGAAASVTTGSFAALPTGSGQPCIVPTPTGNIARVVYAGTAAIRVHQVDCSNATATVTSRHLYGAQDVSTPAASNAWRCKRSPLAMANNAVQMTLPIWASGAYNKRNTGLALSPTREWHVLQDLPECGSVSDTGNSNAESWLLADFSAAQGNGSLFVQRLEMASP